MSRLLHAAARGARLDRLGHITGEWIADGANYQAIQAYPNDFRVHPEDEHLQYGPLSTALRDRALCDVAAVADGVYATAKKYLDAIHPGWLAETVRHSESQEDNLIDYRMSLLFAAEYLADEGL